MEKTNGKKQQERSSRGNFRFLLHVISNIHFSWISALDYTDGFFGNIFL